MNHKAERVSRYGFTSQDNLFLDANIWLYLYGPQPPTSYWVKVYSEVFDRILEAESNVYIDVLVVSEFLNRWARQECELAGYTHDQFKTFRGSLEFKSVAQGITAAIKQIMSYCSQIESGFETLQIDVLLKDLAKGNSDFNDQVITELCRNKSFSLVTHDGDFDHVNIHILTENNHLLNLNKR